MKLHFITTTLLSFSLAYAGSPEQRMNAMQSLLKDSYEYEQRRRELREENRTRAACTPPTEELSYYMVTHLLNIVDRADGKPTTATIWNPDSRLCDWEMLQDDEWTLVEKRYNEWDRLQWEEKKDFVKIWAYGTTGLTVAMILSSYLSK